MRERYVLFHFACLTALAPQPAQSFALRPQIYEERLRLLGCQTLDVFETGFEDSLYETVGLLLLLGGC